MNYTLEVEEYEGAVCVFLVVNGVNTGVWIYNSRFNVPDGSCIADDGFWFEKNPEVPIWEEYMKHRDEYIKEAKKLLVKHYL